ncbi:MAG TPA: ABC transporter ATP-binding protein, partial [Candidatus Dormibacteraeota bacterium]|nr:ABC transporter ATP-binding protein [Candidatus Dormibacteraeota bacterium]
NIVYGLVRPDSGEIVYDGNPVHIGSPQDAIKLGIGMVHQHFMLIPPLTVAENVILGHEIAAGAGVVDQARARTRVADLSKRYGLEVPPAARVQDLSVGIQQRVEILKALYRGARLLILDEPTAVLTPQEVRGLFEVVRALVKDGAAIIFITHKLAEVIEIADKITVMRRGKVVATTTPTESNQADLARLMVGRPVLLRVEKGEAKPGEVLLSLKDLTVQDDRHQVAVDNVSLQVRSGEILGIAGVEGNGQNELVEAIVGLRMPRTGTIRLGSRDITHASTHSTLEAGLGFIPADRQRMGIVLELPVTDNLVLSRFDRRPFARFIVRAFDAVREYAMKLIKAFDIRTQTPDQPAGSLSGGNQQKLVVAREIGTQPKVLLASQPTRGVDVGSIEFIHRRLVEERDNGMGVLLVSSELDEVLSLADRVAVVYRGKVVATFDQKDADRDRIGLLMAGAA